MAIIVRKLWDKVLEHLTENYEFDENKMTDLRFGYFVYWWLVNKENNKSLLDKQNHELVKIAFGDYRGLFDKIERPSYMAFERAIYRKFKEYRSENDYMLTEFVEGLINDM